MAVPFAGKAGLGLPLSLLERVSWMNSRVAEVMHFVRRGRAARAVRYRASSRYKTSFADDVVEGFSAATTDILRLCVGWIGCLEENARCVEYLERSTDRYEMDSGMYSRRVNFPTE
jgi:hypothetical protein